MNLIQTVIEQNNQNLSEIHQCLTSWMVEPLSAVIGWMQDTPRKGHLLNTIGTFKCVWKLKLIILIWKKFELRCNLRSLWMKYPHYLSKHNLFHLFLIL